jgi:uncharacterized protein YigA (DUF484 family)
MPKAKAAKPKAPTLTATNVLVWIEKNPDFLTRHAARLAALQPEADNITPLHAVRAARAEKGQETLQKKQARLLRTVHANSASAADVFAVVPALIRCRTLPQLRKFLQTTLPQQLELDATRLLLAGDASATTLPAEEIEAYFDDQPVTLRTLYDVEDRALYGTKGKTLQSDALVHLQAADGTTLGMLALASKDEQRFYPSQGQELAVFFAHVISAVLEGLR